MDSVSIYKTLKNNIIYMNNFKNMDKEDIVFIESNKDLINTILKNQAVSCIDMVFRNRVYEIAKKINVIKCTTCNSEFLRALSIIVDAYNKYKIENKGDQEYGKLETKDRESETLPGSHNRGRKRKES